ncbi:MAG: hypothetical protein CSYNP_03912 [Syntrophus sp. SKADARSKE-3]|nr:hypothetical protein [Syntrophus sp. SKADARSKE-3]
MVTLVETSSYNSALKNQLIMKTRDYTVNGPDGEPHQDR